MSNNLALISMKGSNRSMISMSDDNVMLKNILETHAPDGLEVHIKPLLVLVEDILHRATMTSETSTKLENNNEKVYQAGSVLTINALSYTIDRVSCELKMKALSNGDAHATAHSILKMLSRFSWEVKLVLALAAFAFNYGEFLLLAQIYSSNNRLAKSMAILKKLPSIMEQSGRLEALNKLIGGIMEVTRCVVRLNDLPPNYIYAADDFPVLSDAVTTHVPTAVYWAIQSVVACVSQIMTLTSMGGQEETTMIFTVEHRYWKLSSLEQRLKNIAEHLQKQMTLCYQHIEEMRSVEAYQNLLAIAQTDHNDNMNILRALFCVKDDIEPLFDGSTKTRVSIEVLKEKHVLLLISGLDWDIFNIELIIFTQIHKDSTKESMKHNFPYEIVWIPIVDDDMTSSSSSSPQYENDDLMINMKNKFEKLQVMMPWLSVRHPDLMDKGVIRVIREVWHFRKKSILVVLDPKGKVVSENGMHGAWIWGSSAFPFSRDLERAHWDEERLTLGLLVDGIDPNIDTWAENGKYIFLYGGEDMDWIRRFTTTAREVASAARIQLEMVYVGKSGQPEQMRRNAAMVRDKFSSYCWEDHTLVWFFWARLKDMLYSFIELERADDKDDPVVQGIKKLISYNDAGDNWAALAHGLIREAELVSYSHGNTMLQTLIEYDIWKEDVRGFDVAFKDHHDKLLDSVVPKPCSRFHFPSTEAQIPDQLKCPECDRLMEKLITFLCCHDDGRHDFC